MAGSPYVATCDVRVPSGGTLTIDAGVEVRFQAGTRLNVQGTLDVNGSSGSEVSFTSDASSPAAADWAGLQFASTSTGSTIEYASIAYATNAIYVNAAAVDLDHVETTYSNRGVYLTGSVTVAIDALTSRFNGDGLYFYDSNSAVTVTNSTLTDNSQYGVYLNGDYSSTSPDLIITRSSIHSNLGDYDYYTLNYVNPATTVLWAPDNWWGTTSHQQIAARIRDHDDATSCPRIRFKPFGMLCEVALGGDADSDGLGDFQDNCPVDWNNAQSDGDGDSMGDDCDPEPFTAPAGTCDGVTDVAEGHADSDGDGWGDPCDFQPTRDDCYPGAPELCDGRDNDGDGQFLPDELADADSDDGLTCGDCDETDPGTNSCSCEDCGNLLDDDCDTLFDGDDPDCDSEPVCLIVASGASHLYVDTGPCGGATSSGPFDFVRGSVAELQIVGGSVDLGQVDCVAGALAWDRVTEWSGSGNPACNDSLSFYLARETGSADFGAASSGEPRDVMTPDPPCP